MIIKTIACDKCGREIPNEEARVEISGDMKLIGPYNKNTDHQKVYGMTINRHYCNQCGRDLIAKMEPKGVAASTLYRWDGTIWN